MTVEDPTARFAELMARDESAVPLDEGALLVAAHAHPGLNLDEWLVRLDELAAAAPDEPAALAHHLFVTEGFAGNRVDYSDPRNSLLDDVIDRRLGIPITLSILMIEVGRRIGVPVHGVGMPGHFLVGVDDDRRRAPFFDPFHDGPSCRRRRLRGAASPRCTPASPFDPHYLAPIGTAGDPAARAQQPQQSYLERELGRRRSG